MYGISTVRKILLIKNREKLSIRKTAKRFGLSTRTVYKWDKGIISKGKRICKARKLDMEGLKEDVMSEFTLSAYGLLIDSKESILLIFLKVNESVGLNFVNEEEIYPFKIGRPFYVVVWILVFKYPFRAFFG